MLLGGVTSENHLNVLRGPQLPSTAEDKGNRLMHSCFRLEEARGGKNTGGDRWGWFSSLSLRLMYKCHLDNVLNYREHPFKCVPARHAGSGRSAFQQIQAGGTESECFVSGVSDCERIFGVFIEPMRQIVDQAKVPKFKSAVLAGSNSALNHSCMKTIAYSPSPACLPHTDLTLLPRQLANKVGEPFGLQHAS